MSVSRFVFCILALPLAAAAAHIYVTNSDDDKISVIDPAVNRVVREIAVSPNPHGIVESPDGQRLYVSSESKDLLDVIDRASGRIVRRVPLGTRPNNVAITADGRRVYVCIRGGNVVDIVDTASLERVKSVPVGAAPHNVYRTPDGRYMIATSMGDRKLTAIDVASEKPAFEIPLDGVPRPLAIDAGADGTIRRLFVQLSNLHGFEIVDYAARKPAGRVLLPQAPAGARPLIPATFSHGIGIAPDHKTLWVNSLLDNSVSVFSLPELRRMKTIGLGRGPDWLTFTPDGSRCYISEAGANTVAVIDTANLREIARIPVGKVPKRLIAAD